MPRTFVWHRSRGPKTTPKPLPETGGDLRIKQVRSGIREPARTRRTLRVIGLRHHQDEIVRPNTATIRGQLRRVRHLVEVTPVELTPIEEKRRRGK
jgi:large subunit ribosomal protein L30